MAKMEIVTRKVALLPEIGIILYNNDAMIIETIPAVNGFQKFFSKG